MSVRSIRLADDVWAKLQNGLKDSPLKSFNEYFNSFFEGPHSESESSSGDNVFVDVPERPQKRRKINVRPPLYSFESLADRHHMLEYLTGLDQETILLLVDLFDEVSGCFFFRASLTPPALRLFTWAVLI